MFSGFRDIDMAIDLGTANTLVYVKGRGIARFIDDASFIELPGNNHVILGGTPAFDQFFEEVTVFLAKHNQ